MNRNIVCMAFISWLMIFLFGQLTNSSAGWILILHPLVSIGLVAAAYWFNRTPFDLRSGQWRVAIWFIVCFGVTFATAYFQRSLGLGSAWEITTYYSLATWAATLAVMSRLKFIENVAVLLTAASVFFLLAMAQGWQYYVLGTLYGVCLIWWSMTSYWKTLDQKFADEHRSQLSTRGIVLFVSLASIFAACGAAALVVSTQSASVNGYSWFSGGQRWSDDYARDGVGDGNMVRAATENAASFAPVDSKLFIESVKPTFFDVATDMYGTPKKKNIFNRAIAVDQQNFKHDHQKMGRNQRASSEFSTRRSTDNRRRLNRNDHISDALFFFQGRTPTWLAIETYDTFQDGVWSQQVPQSLANHKNADLDPNANVPLPGSETQTIQVSHSNANLNHNEHRRQVELTERYGKPWMMLYRFPEQSIYSAEEYSAVKVINFRSTRIPSTPCLEQFYIDKVNKSNFFKLESDGIVSLDNNSPHIPEMTVIHQLSKGINLYQAKVDPEFLAEKLDRKQSKLAPYLEQNAIDNKVKSTADKWCLNASSDWQKVETIVNNLRTQFTHRPQAVLSEYQNDVATQLLSTGGGTDYMFATTAALMFRSQDIPSRTVSGFFVAPENYDRNSGHTIVLPSDIHVWTEVSLDGKHWIPVEATPGYPTPKYELTWLQKAHLACIDSFNWMAANPPLLFALLVYLGVAIYYRKSIVNAMYTLRWLVMSKIFPDRIVIETATLVENRAKLAGLSRPAHTSIAAHNRALSQHLFIDEKHKDLHARFIEALNRILYYPVKTPRNELQFEADQQSCYAVQRQFGFLKLKNISSSHLGGVK